MSALHCNRWEHFNPRSPHGERRAIQKDKAFCIDISTHAPRTGSDPQTKRKGKKSKQHFNPRSPHGERHTGGQADSSGQAISTHAPRTGSDSFALLAAYRAIPFQPTLPARGATILKVFYSSRCRFQPTLPARGATRTRPLSSKGFIKFQPTLPARGATMPLSIISRQDLPFQPTLPARGATKY